MRRTALFIVLLPLLACRPAAVCPSAPCASAAPATGQPTVAEAEAFIKQVEEELLKLWTHRDRMNWVNKTHLTHDTDLLAAEGEERVMEYTARRAAEATRYDKLPLSDEARRKLKLLKLSQTLPAPRDPALRSELARVATELESTYGKGKYCPPRLGGKCLSLLDLEDVLAKRRSYDELLDAWRGWHSIAVPMREKYRRYVELANAGARSLGFADLGELWRSKYDMTPAEFAAETDRLWRQVKPLYDDLHCYVRARLGEKYGTDRVPANGLIPAHLLGNMWAQQWGHIKDLLAPPKGNTMDLTAALVDRKTDERALVRMGEAFFVSLGLDPLPATFWERSMFKKPADREVVCHASAWDIDQEADLRIKMCIKINEEDFTVVHHELGHNYYQYYYRHLSPLFRDSAHDGFHEGLGDTIALSVTPVYLEKIGLLRGSPPDEVNALLDRALDKVAFLPWGLLVDRWRWEVFSGKVGPGDYNRRWWELRRKYQGVAPPLPRTEQDFDPGAKYHIPANVPYTRYFLAGILQFQLHRALCRIAGHSGPLHTCSVYGNKEVGRRLRAMMEMGQSRSWPDALRALTGEPRTDASAILAYFAPLHAWLREQNRGRQCGW
jgi:peptidyl-dipeptidase A